MCGWTANAPLRWTSNSDGSAVVRLYGYRDDRPRGYRVRVDGGAWTAGTLQGDPGTWAPSIQFYTSPTLGAGAHAFELEWASGEALTFDYYTVTTGEATAPPAAPPAPKAVCEDALDNDSDGKTDYPNDPGCSSLTDSDEYNAPPQSPAECNIAPANGQTAIAAAIASCADGKTVKFPANASYTQNGAIVVNNRSNLVIDANGATFKSTLTPVANPTEFRPQWAIRNGTNVTLKNAKITGNWTPPTTRTKIQGNQFDFGVAVKGGDGVTVNDNTISNVYGDGVIQYRSDAVFGNAMLGTPSRNVKYLRNTITGAARMCLTLGDVLGAELSDNRLTDCHYDGIDLELDVGGHKIQDVKVLRNKISGYYISGIGLAGETTNPELISPGDMARVEIRDNTIGQGDTCWPPITIGDPANNRGPFSDVTVAGNFLTSQGYAVRFNDVNGGSITGNDATLTKSPGWCGITGPFNVLRSTGVATSGNTPRGY